VLVDIKKIEKMREEQRQAHEAQQRKQQEEIKSFAQLSRWVLGIIIALAAAIGGAWGGRRVLPEKSTSAVSSAMPRVRPIGLGADGKGGVWLRGVPPWEK
jgi:hypothetical protein